MTHTKTAKSADMTFGEALVALKNFQKVARKGWNGKGMYLFLELFDDKTAGWQFEPAIVMFTAQGKYQPGWLASQADMLAEDWVIVPEES